MRCPWANTPGFNSREGLRPGEAEGTPPLRARGTLAPIPPSPAAALGAVNSQEWCLAGLCMEECRAIVASGCCLSGYLGKRSCLPCIGAPQAGSRGGATVGSPLLLLVPSQGLVQ